MAPRRVIPRPEPTPLALRLRSAREHAGLTQRDLAAKCALTDGRVIWRFEVEARVPDADELASIARVCAVDPGWLLTGDCAPEWFDADAARRSLHVPSSTEAA